MSTSEARIKMKNNRPTIGLALLCTLFSLSLIGCQGLVPIEDSIPVVERYQPDDIPAPFGFELDNESWSYLKFEHAPLPMRTVEVIYWGDRPILELASWYKEQMPIHGWEYVSAQDDFGEQQIRYRKPGEYAEVLIKRIPDDQGQNYVTKLVVRIGVDS